MNKNKNIAKRGKSTATKALWQWNGHSRGTFTSQGAQRAPKSSIDIPTESEQRARRNAL